MTSLGSQQSDQNSGSSSGSRLRIGIDGTCLAVQRGYGRFLRELLPPLLTRGGHHEYLMFIDRQSSNLAAEFDIPVYRVETGSAQSTSASARANRSPLDLLRMGRAVSRAELDVMYFPSVYSYYPVPGKRPVAVALHDTIAERYSRVVFPSTRTRLLWRLKVFLARRRASGIITVSEWSRQQLSDWFSIPRETIHVTPEAPAQVFCPPEAEALRDPWFSQHDIDPEAPYYVYVGGFNPHKNLRNLIAALASVRKRLLPIEARLIMVGDYKNDLFHSEVKALTAEIHEQALHGLVRFVGFVPDQNLRNIYGGAVALVMPSLEEGFGLPAVEAAACGTPCIATCNSPLPQLLAEGGIFIDPLNRDQLADAMVRMASDPQYRDRLAKTALERAGRLTWENTADATLRALSIIAGRPSAQPPAQAQTDRS